MVRRLAVVVLAILALPVAVSVAALTVATRTVEAQGGPPDVASIAGALALRGVVSDSSEQSCSQSFQTVTRTARLALAVDARGATRLVVEATTLSRTGSSRFSMQPGEISEITELERVVFTGAASRTAGALEIDLTRAESASARYAGAPAFDPALLPTPTSAPTHVHLRCAIARLDVFPAEWSPAEHEAETSRAIPLVECVAGALPAPLDELTTPRLVLGRGAGVQESSADDPWGGEPRRTLRALE